MLAKLKHTLKHTAIYSIGGVANKLIGLILLPLYTSYLTSFEYGMLAILEVTNQVFISLVGLKLSTAMMRWYTSEKNPEKKKSIVFTSITGVLICILLYNLAFHPFTDSFSELFFSSTEYSNYFRYLIIWGSFEIINLYISDLLRINEKSVFYIIIMSIKLTLILVLNILFIVKLKLGILGIIYGNLLGSLFISIVTLPFLIKNINFRIQLSILKEMLKFSIPLIFTNISGLILTLGDRYFIKHFLTYHEVGIYSIGFKIVNVIKLIFIQSFQIGFIPIAYKMFHDKDAKRFFSKLFTYFTLILIFISILFSFFSKELLVLITNDNAYIEVYLIIPLLATTIILRGVQVFFTLGFHYSKKTKKTTLILFIAVIINVVLNLLLIPRFELYGASVSTILSSLFIVYFYSRASQKYYHIPYELNRLFILVFIFVSYISVFYLITSFSYYMIITIKIILVIAFPFLLLKLKFFSIKELETVKETWKRWKNLRN